MRHIKIVFSRLIAFYRVIYKNPPLRYAALVLAAFIAYYFILQIRKTSITRTGETYALVQRGDFEILLVESGDVEAISQITISAPQIWGGNLQIVQLVPEGTIVQPGDTVVQFDVSDLQNQLILAEENVEAIYADIEKLKAQQGLTIRDRENQVQLAEYSLEQAELSLQMRQFESEARRQEAGLQLRQAEISMENNKIQLESQKVIHNSQLIRQQTLLREAKNNVQSIIDRIDRMHLTAPTGGMIVYEYFQGQRIKEGFDAQPGWPLMSIPDLDHLQIRCYINEVDRLKIYQGQKTRIFFDAYPDLVLTGVVQSVSSLAQKVRHDTELRGFAVNVIVQGKDQRLKPGMTAKVYIILENISDVLYVNAGAVFELNNEPVVFPKKRNRPVSVITGKRNDDSIIIETGVREGDILLYKPPEDLQGVYALGRVSEDKRIAALRGNVLESFSVFQERGILFDYLIDDTAGGDTQENPPVNLDRLPASIQKRLRQLKPEEQN